MAPNRTAEATIDREKENFMTLSPDLAVLIRGRCKIKLALLRRRASVLSASMRLASLILQQPPRAANRLFTLQHGNLAYCV
jgi:hypothetical protein